MDRIMRLTCVALIMALLSSCAGGPVQIPYTLLGQDGEVVETGFRTVADASVAKEIAVHETLRNRDRQYARAYQQSGFDVEFELVEVAPGLKVQVMKRVGFREAPDFSTPLPTAPSVHPVWHTVDNVVDNIGRYGLIGYSVHEGAGVLKAGIDALKDSGGGDRINITASDEAAIDFDQKRGEQTVTAGNDATVVSDQSSTTMIKPKPEEPVEGEKGSEEEGEFYTSGPAPDGCVAVDLVDHPCNNPGYGWVNPSTGACCASTE